MDSATPAVALATGLPLHRDALLLAFAGWPTIVFDPQDTARAIGHVVIIDRLTEDFDEYLSAASVRGLTMVVWGGYLHRSSVQALVRDGIAAYVSVIGSIDQLHDAVRTVRAGFSWLPALSTESPAGLSTAERRALTAYLLDYPSLGRAEVARLLGLSEATLKAHLANVRAQLDDNCSSRAGLRRALVARGWLVADQPERGGPHLTSG